VLHGLGGVTEVRYRRPVGALSRPVVAYSMIMTIFGPYRVPKSS
jgi:hypothetical protein